jgi:flavin reductase (DIM6/NTAB) family NADH-FMN oxidoreductase RutF
VAAGYHGRMPNHPVYDALYGDLDPPVIVVTVSDGHERSGCLVGFTSQCSIDPLRTMVWLSKRNHTYRVATRGTVLAAHVLRRGDEELARLFGEETGDEVDKFARCSWSPGEGGVPLLDGCDHYVGRIVDRRAWGDHAGFVIEVLPGGRAERSDEPPLRFGDVHRLQPGHEA